MTTAGSLSGIINNGQQLQISSGYAAINVNDLVEIGGPGNEAWTVGTADYAANATAGPILAQTQIVAATMPFNTRIQLARDRLGNIYHAGTNSGGNLVIYKGDPLWVTVKSAILDATATTINSPRLFQLQSGAYACVYARGAGALYYVVFDAALNLIAGPTSVATEFASTNVVHHDAVAISGGGFAIVYQTSAGTALNLVTVTNAGVATAVGNIQTLAGSAALQYLKVNQLSSGNLICAYRGTMTASGTAGTSFTIFTTGGANVSGPTNVDSVSTAGIIELSVLTGYFAISAANGTNLKCGSYSNAGALQGSVFSTADTLNSTTSVQVKLINDTVQFWLCYFGSAANGLNVIQIPTVDATTGVSAKGFSAATLSATTYALDAEIINGMVVALAASSTTNGQYWLSVALPDASLGITAPYLRTGATAFGTSAATTGSNWPRLMSGGAGLYTGASPPAGQPVNTPSNGDFTAIIAYDHQNTAQTFIGIQKFESTSIQGVAQTNVAAGTPGTNINVNPGPGSYVCNAMSGTTDLLFDHSILSPAGNKGTLFGLGATLSNPASNPIAVPNSPTGFLGTVINSTLTYTATQPVMITLWGVTGSGSFIPAINGQSLVGLNILTVAGNPSASVAILATPFYLGVGQTFTLTTSGAQEASVFANKVP